MSDNTNCEEQREEQTELEEAGGAEVRWFNIGIVSSQHCVFRSFGELPLQSKFPKTPFYLFNTRPYPMMFSFHFGTGDANVH